MKKLLKAYVKNIFDGKITTLIGFALVVAGTVAAFRPETEYITVIELVGLGLVIMGVPDPRLGQRRNDPPSEP
jgi:uncharacterized membrane protein HdeD (DUF308 family)